MMAYRILFLLLLCAGCTTSQEQSILDALFEYEGRYEYVGESTLDIVVSELDTTLNAVIDDAKYPLKYIRQDSFVDIQNTPVLFTRNESGVVTHYSVDDQVFKLLDTDFERMEMNPRRELSNNPDQYQYNPPSQLEDALAVGPLSDAFEDTELILQMVKNTIQGDYPDVHSILIYKNDRLVLEEYFYGYSSDKPHQLRSATKPFIGGILGIAVAQGYIKSAQDKLLPYFASTYREIANMDDQKEQVTIENFLMYRHGMDCENDNAESEGSERAMMQTDDWVKHTLDLPMVAQPGEFSSYCTGCALTIGRLIEVATDQQIEDFAKEQLFEPLGITNYDWAFEPNPASETTFSQLYLTSRDLVKLAKMYKENGRWNNEQIIPEEWVRKTFDMEKGDYGYLWEHKYFMVNGKEYNSYLATGNGGQKISIWPELDMITVFTGGNYNSYAIYGKSTPPNEMIPKYILNAL